MNKRKAFTLIELLVVIAIIAILAAILFPVFAQAKMAAKKTVSLSNMKQTALASQIYTNDFDDTLPAGGDIWNIGYNDPLGWNDTPQNLWTSYGSPGPEPFTPNYPNPDIETNPLAEIAPYIKSMGMLNSPVSIQDTGVGTSYLTTSGAGNSSYIVNGGIEGMSVTNASNPADLILFAEGPTDTRVSYAQPQQFPAADPHCVNGIDINWSGEFFANDSGNYAFGDGHAKSFPRSGVSYEMYGLGGWVFETVSGAWQPNTFKMRSLNSGTNNNNNWESCGHVDLPSMDEPTGDNTQGNSGGNPCA